MAEYKLKITDKLVETIKDMGYDLHSYFDEVFTKPLVAKHRTALEVEAVVAVKSEIDEKVDKAKGEVLLEEVKEPPKDEEPTPIPDPEPTPEPLPEDPPAEEEPIEP